MNQYGLRSKSAHFHAHLSLAPDAPYDVQQVGSQLDGFTLAWKIDDPEGSRVTACVISGDFGEVKVDRPKLVEAGQAVVWQKTVDGLKPGKTYNFKIVASDVYLTPNQG